VGGRQTSDRLRSIIGSSVTLSSQGKIRERGPAVAGFNVGVNLGAVGGQTIPHCHLHLIPRRPGDVPNPAQRRPPRRSGQGRLRGRVRLGVAPKAF
jgi:diadenosine tetraphosphate (Ap4A) HIT family hydrolase